MFVCLCPGIGCALSHNEVCVYVCVCVLENRVHCVTMRHVYVCVFSRIDCALSPCEPCVCCYRLCTESQ